MKPDKPSPIENLQEGLSQHARFLSREERKSELQSRGMDVEGFLKDAHATIYQAQKNVRLAWMKEAQKKKQATDQSHPIVSWLTRETSEITVAFQNLINTTNQTIAFRNKTELTIEDMARILDDYERLRSKNIDVNLSKTDESC